jgi:hypothetical protein
LDYLNKVGVSTVKGDYSTALKDMALKNRGQMNLSEREAASYWMGDVGIQLVHWRFFQPMHSRTRFIEPWKQT